MKKLLIASLLTMVLATVSTAATYQLVYGPAYTNYTIEVGASATNAGSANLVTNNTQIGVVLATTTNYYNMPSMAGVYGSGTGVIGGNQANTNSWPAVGFQLVGYPNTLYAPANNFGINTYVNTLNLASTNTSVTNVYMRFAGYDGYNWVSNVFLQTLQIPASTVSASQYTNFCAGGTMTWSGTMTGSITNAFGTITNQTITLTGSQNLLNFPWQAIALQKAAPTMRR